MKESSKDVPNNTSQQVIRTIVVDDEPLAREEMSFLLKGHHDVRIVAQGENGIEAFELIKEHQPDLVILDVSMPGQNGLELVARLLDKRSKIRMPQVIFATAYDQHAVRAFELNAIDYLLKPIDKARLAQSMERVRRTMEGASSSSEKLDELVRILKEGSPPVQTKLVVRTAGRLLMIDPSQLVLASIEDGSITISTKELEGVSNFRTIEELQASLDPASFWRVHRSFIVNINHVKEVVPWFKGSYQLRMDDKNGTEVPVSRAQTKRLRDLLKL
jgi:two-component system response regulator LytT